MYQETSPYLDRHFCQLKISETKPVLQAVILFKFELINAVSNNHFFHFLL
jgi:hypothetical protein